MKELQLTAIMLSRDSARPELIGMHYFQWVDQPYYGRFDGENYNIGVVTIQNLPYRELTEAMRITNERIYMVGSGLEEPFKADITKDPANPLLSICKGDKIRVIIYWLLLFL